MELIENIKKLKHKLSSNVLNAIPSAHLIAVSALSAVLGLVSLLPSEEASASRQVRSLSLPPVETHAKELENSLIEESTEKKATLKKTSLKVRSGDSLSLLFKRAGLTDTQMMNFIAAADNSKKLEAIVPGHTVEFFTDKGSIVKISYISSKLSKYSYVKQESGFRFIEENRKPDIHLASRSGTITNSLYNAGISAGVDDKLIMELAEMFGWDIDFALDIRKGDSFRILYEEQFLDGEKLGDGAILSAEFNNQNQRFQAVRYVHSDGRAQYYTPEGRNMRKAFLRAPVDFRRISDSFNPRRLHPVTKTVRPHRGIDYAAKTGTPVWSSGDGKVIASAYHKYNGNYVVIQHGNNVKTKYLHLNKRKVKKGDRVRQKQIIGTVGTTGLSTGPHLHYEFLLNGVHRNPRTIVQKLPKAESISSKLKNDFLSKTAPLIAQLIAETEPQLASLNEGDTRTAL